MAAICLHNFLSSRSETRKAYIPDHLVDSENAQGEVIPGTRRQDRPNKTYTRPVFSGLRASVEAKRVQEVFKEFFQWKAQFPGKKNQSELINFTEIN